MHCRCQIKCLLGLEAHFPSPVLASRGPCCPQSGRGWRRTPPTSSPPTWAPAGARTRGSTFAPRSRWALKRDKNIIHYSFSWGTTNDMSKQSCDCCPICLNSSTDLDNKGCARLQCSKPSCSQNASLDAAKCQALRERERGLARSAFQSACSVKCRVSTHLPRPTVI